MKGTVDESNRALIDVSVSSNIDSEPSQVVANEGKYPLLGTGLLDGRVLSVNYVTKQLSLD